MGFILKNKERITYFAQILILALLIYLPFLGSREFQGNESRRAMIAEKMLQNQDWMLPELAGEKYYKKPPLLNWLIAISSIFHGGLNEFSARIISSLSVIFLAILLLSMPSGWLTQEERFFSATILLTSYGMIVFGRMIEIEAFYVVITGVAILFWCNMESLLVSDWLKWPLTGLILGAGLLTKGPIILLFFYLPIVFILIYSRKTKALFSLAHFVGITIMILPFFIWAHKVKQLSPVENRAFTVWQDELLSRFTMEEFSISGWFSEILSVFILLVPWLVFLPLIIKLWRKLRAESDFRANIFKGLCMGMLTCFIIVSLMPNTKSRYLSPILPIFSFALAYSLNRQALPQFLLKIWQTGIMITSFFISFIGGISLLFIYTGIINKILTTPSIAKRICFQYQPPVFLTALLFFCVILFANFAIWQSRRNPLSISSLLRLSNYTFVSLVMIFFIVFIPIENVFARKRYAGKEINDSLPKDKTLYIFNIGYMPFFYYVREPKEFIYPSNISCKNMEYLIINNSDFQDFLDTFNRENIESSKKLIVIKEINYKRKAYKLLNIYTKENRERHLL